MDRKESHYTITEERLRSLDPKYLADIVRINEEHLDDPEMRTGAEIRLAALRTEVLRRQIGVVGIQAV